MTKTADQDVLLFVILAVLAPGAYMVSARKVRKGSYMIR